MKDPDQRAFADLFRNAYRKCFGNEISTPLTESESLRLSVVIEESTGLEIGWKSLKNYSQHVLGTSPGKEENPSTPTLDTLARYVAGAPATTSGERRRRGPHYPFWYDYRERFHLSDQPAPSGLLSVDSPDADGSHRAARTVAPARVIGLIALIGLLIVVAIRPDAGITPFLDEFEDVSSAALAARGWRVKDLDSSTWAVRDSRAGHLTLLTLGGDNWPQPGTQPMIRNLLVRDVPSDCFITDVRFSGFVPAQNWQQAGILLLEDTAFAGKALRLSIGYNDYAGGFPETAEILVQAITSLGRDTSNPEEIAHHRLFAVEPALVGLIARHLEHAALRIERRGRGIRLLYSTGPMENAAFKEVVSTEFSMRPAYIGVFALKGFVEGVPDMPVHLDRFGLMGQACED